MTAFFARRIAWALATVVLVTSSTFVLMFAVGDPAVATLGPRARQDQLQAFRKRYGLDRPLLTQYLSFVGLSSCLRHDGLVGEQVPGDVVAGDGAAGDGSAGGAVAGDGATHSGKGTEPTRSKQVDAAAGTPRGATAAQRSRPPCGLLQGDLGASYAHQEPVSRVIGQRIPRTLLLGAMAMALELLLGVSMGALAAWRRGRFSDRAVVGLSYLGISLPSFVAALWALDVLAFRFGWFPVGGYGEGAWAHVRHAMLPALVMALLGMATYARVVRGELIEILESGYVRTARAKGAGPWRVFYRHALRNALLPVVTLIGLQLPALVSGAIITESIFAWPGMGHLAVESLYNLDAPMVMGIVVISCVLVQAGNLAADVAVAALDPRIRLSE